MGASWSLGGSSNNVTGRSSIGIGSNRAVTATSSTSWFRRNSPPNWAKTSEDERRRAKTSLQLLLDFTDVLGSRINRSIDLSPSSSVIFHRVVSVHWITKVQPWHRNRVRWWRSKWSLNIEKCWKLDQNFKHQRNMGIRWEKIGKLADFAIQWSNVIQLFNVIRWSENAWQISPPKSWCRETRCNLVPRQKSNTSDRKWLGHVNVSKLAKGKYQQHVNTMPTNRNRLDSLDPWWSWDNHDMHVQVLSKSCPSLGHGTDVQGPLVALW